MKKKLLFAINVDWYFQLHWQDRVLSELTDDFDIELCLNQTNNNFKCAGCKISRIGIDRASVGIFNNLKTFYFSYQILKKTQPDLIHSVTVKPNIFFGILSRIYSKSIIITVPGLGTVFSSTGFRYNQLKKILIFLYRFIGKNKKSHFVFENNSDHKSFIDWRICSQRNSTVVAGAGVDIDSFPYTPEKTNNNMPIKILFAARLLRGKGLEDLVEAVRILNKHKKKFSLDVAGIIDNDSREAIDFSQIIKWNRQGDINWLGRVDNMPALLSDVHIVALPTRYGEGLPRILLEAASSGRPLITTDIPGCNDFVENGITGLLVTPGAGDQLISAIETLNNIETRVALGLAGRRKVEKGFTKTKVIQCYSQIYTKLMGC